MDGIAKLPKTPPDAFPQAGYPPRPPPDLVPGCYALTRVQASRRCYLSCRAPAAACPGQRSGRRYRGIGVVIVNWFIRSRRVAISSCSASALARVRVDLLRFRAGLHHIEACAGGGNVGLQDALLAFGHFQVSRRRSRSRSRRVRRRATSRSFCRANSSARASCIRASSTTEAFSPAVYRSSEAMAAESSPVSCASCRSVSLEAMEAMVSPAST